MKKAIVASLCLLFMFFNTKAQEPFIKRGNLRAQATITPARMIESTTGTIYIHGDLEYYFDERLSVRGDSYYFLSHNSGPEPFAYNHSTFAGLAYHFTSEKKFDPYIAFEPGVAFSRVQYLRPLLAGSNEQSFDPLISGAIGMNFYATRFFHLLAHVRYVHGKHLSDAWVIDMKEVRFSFGLGWNLRVKKYDSSIKNVNPGFSN